MKLSLSILTFLFSINLFAAKIDLAYLCSLGPYPDELDVIAVVVTENGEITTSIKKDIVDPGNEEDCKKLATILNSKQN